MLSLLIRALYADAIPSEITVSNNIKHLHFPWVQVYMITYVCNNLINNNQI